jgi:hypothetical protein
LGFDAEKSEFFEEDAYSCHECGSTYFPGRVARRKRALLYASGAFIAALFKGLFPFLFS